MDLIPVHRMLHEGSQDGIFKTQFHVYPQFMNIQDMIEKVKSHPESNRIGMMTSHLGIVRGHSRDGKDVLAVQVVYEREQLDKIVYEMKSRAVIIEILVQANEGRVELGDELLAVVVAGDLRENVFPVLIETVDRIKSSACRKNEVYR